MVLYGLLLLIISIVRAMLSFFDHPSYDVGVLVTVLLLVLLVLQYWCCGVRPAW